MKTSEKLDGLESGEIKIKRTGFGGECPLAFVTVLHDKTPFNEYEEITITAARLEAFCRAVVERIERTGE